MAFDAGPTHGPPECAACHLLIVGETPTQVWYSEGHEINGLYHAYCAKPILAVLRAMRTMERGWSGH